MSLPQASLQPSWDDDPARKSRRPEASEDFFEETGIASLKAPARFTIACLCFYIIFHLVGLLGTRVIDEAHQSAGSDGLLRIGIGLSGMAGLVSYGLGLPLLICVILGFLLWLVGAAHNAEIIDDVDLHISPGWQAGWYAIPFFNLIIPCLGMLEILSHSHPRRPDLAFLLTLVWWATWILGTFGIYLARLAGPPPSDSVLIYTTILDVSAALLTSCAAVFLIFLIRVVTKSQAACAARFAAAQE